jgi:2-C-methyl-D-erythritol 4-phosphate cytidylyltransferase / 2-C-methyl-D-erythritol 2,4-cyclodiphosphate synthase
MSDAPLICAVVLAAGSGSRAGGSSPKQFQYLAGRRVMDWSLQSFAAHPLIGDIVLVLPPDDCATTCPIDGVRVIAGGATRRASVGRAIADVVEHGSLPAYILIHDAARPGVDALIVDRLLEALTAGASSAIPVMPVVDTLVQAADEATGAVIDRSVLRRVQTPQGFSFAALRAAHEGWVGPDEPTDDAQMVRQSGGKVIMVEGSSRLEKITLPGDLERMEHMLSPAMEVRCGTGFDVHRLVAGEDLWLCGVNVPHSHGLAGHSDADVAIHALVDAMLGALAEGDIGTHFPPSEAQWRGAPSSAFLEFAASRVAARGGRIVHVDVTIICEAPKIGPHRDAMRTRLAALLGVREGRVSVKATTTEQLGFTGRREGIAAQAAVTITLPVENGQ